MKKNILSFITFALILTACCSDDKAREAAGLLESNIAKDRNKGAMALASCGSKAKDSVPKLIQLLYDSNVGVQSSAAYALRKIDTPQAREALDRATKK